MCSSWGYKPGSSSQQRSGHSFTYNFQQTRPQQSIQQQELERTPVKTTRKSPCPALRTPTPATLPTGELSRPLALPTLVSSANHVSPAPRMRCVRLRPRAAKQATAEALPAWTPTSRYAYFSYPTISLSRYVIDGRISATSPPRAARRRPAASSPAASVPARRAARAVPGPAQGPVKRMLSDDDD